MRIARGDEIGRRRGPLDADEPPPLDSRVESENDLFICTQRERELFGIGAIADDDDVIPGAGRAPCPKLPAKDDPEAAEQRKVEDRCGSERAEQCNDVLVAQERAVERKGEQHRIDRILPARRLDRRRPDQTPRDHEHNGNNRKDRDEGGEEIAALARTRGHGATSPTLRTAARRLRRPDR